jgi:hypothetical protein
MICVLLTMLLRLCIKYIKKRSITLIGCSLLPSTSHHAERTGAVVREVEGTSADEIVAFFHQSPDLKSSPP